MPWLRLWTDILDDVDLHALPRETRWAWTAFLAAAKRHDKDGVLPELKVLAHWIREPAADVSRWTEELVTAGLLDRNGVTVALHGWERWQAATDRTGAKRQAAWRARHQGGNSPPPDPPEERIEERRVEVTPLVTPLRNGHPDGPSREESQIIARATERWGASNGDVVIGDLLREYPAAWVRVACDAEWDRHGAALNVPYLRGILRGYQRSNGPPAAPRQKGGEVPYKPTVIAMTPSPRPVGPDPSIPAEEAMRIMLEAAKARRAN